MVTRRRIGALLGALAAAAFLSLSSGLAGWLPISESPVPRLFQRALVWFDAPISAVGLFLPIKGAWLFFSRGQDRGVAPDLFAMLTNQLLIGIPTYLMLFWLLSKTLARLSTRNSAGENWREA